MSEADLIKVAEELSKNFKENILVLCEPFFDLRQCATLLNKETSASFNASIVAYRSALLSNKDKLVRAKALRAFASCYSDLGLDEKAAEMTKKWQELAQEALEP